MRSKNKSLNVFNKIKNVLIVLFGIICVCGAMSLFSTANVVGIVYAQRVEINREAVPTEIISLEVINGQETVKPGGQFIVKATQEPWFTTTASFFEVVEGTAEVNQSGVVTVSPEAAVGSTITVKATADGNSDFISVLVEKIAVEEVLISYSMDVIQAGADFVPTVTVNPLDASFKIPAFEVASGNEYAYTSADGGKIIVKGYKDIPTDDESFSVRALVDGVYSNELTFGIYRPTNSVELNADKFIAKASGAAGDTVQFGFTVNNEESQKEPIYKVISGVEYVDNIDENGVFNGELQVKKGITNKNAKITVVVTVDGVQSQSIEIAVYIPTEGVNFVGSDADRTAVKGQLIYDFGAAASPIYASNTAVEYLLDVGNNIAEIAANGVLTVKEAALIGQVIKITAVSVDGASVTKTVTVERVEAESILFADILVNGETPTYSESGDMLVLPDDVISFDASFTPFNVTNKTYFVSFVHGSANYVNIAAISGNTITIKPLSAMNNDNPYFIVKLVSYIDSVETVATKTIRIYVPAETVSFGLTSIDRDALSATSLNPTINYGYASNKIIEYRNIQLSQSNASATITGNSIKVSQNAVAGTTITFEYKLADSDWQALAAPITVNALDVSKLTLTLGQDSGGRDINLNAPQLEEGQRVDLILRYNGVGAAANFGVSYVVEQITNNATLTIGAQDNGGDLFGLSAKSGQSGRNNIITYRIIVNDGTSSYVIETDGVTAKPVSIFKRISGNIGVSNTIMEKGDTFTLTGWDTSATFNEGDLSWSIGGGTLDGGHKITSSPNSGFVLTLSAKQKYNGQDISWSATVGFAGVTYKNGATVLKTVYKKTGASLTLLGSQYSKTNYVQSGWATSENGGRAYKFSEVYSGASDLILYPYWTLVSQTLHIYDGASIKLNEDKGQSHTNNYTMYYDLAKLKELGYTKIRITGSIEVKTEYKTNLHTQDIWLDINNRNAWGDYDFDITSNSWHRQTFSVDVDISKFTDSFTVRFGFESKGEIPIHDDSWWFNAADLTFVAI